MTLRYLAPSETRTTYVDTRRRSLNFESVGGEPAAALEVTRRAPHEAPAYVSRRYVVIGLNKGSDMKKDNHETSDSRAPGFVHERRESFVARGAVSAVITTRSGDVSVRASSDHEVSVVLGSNRAGRDEVLRRAIITFDDARLTLEIETIPRAKGRSSGVLRDWLTTNVDDVDVIVTLPEGSDLQVTTMSGDTHVGVALGEVKITSASGDVVATDTLDDFDVRTASGDVTAGRVLKRLRCRVASGDVTCTGAAQKTDITSASGDVIVTATDPGALSVNSASGDVTVLVSSGLGVDVTGNTMSGSLRSAIDLSAGDAGDSDQLSFIKVNTMSGDIVIDRARR